MKRLLTLLALAGLSATAVACGDDSGDDGDKGTGNQDSGLKNDATVVRPKQIDNLGAACTKDTDCQGQGDVECLLELGGADMPVEGGYCTAQCNADAECGDNGACPVAALASNPLFAQFAQLLGGIVPQQCIQKCTPSDASIKGSCTRDEHLCQPLLPADILSGPAGMIIPGALKAPYCFPEVDIQIPGVGDAGPRDSGTATVTGLDSGT